MASSQGQRSSSVSGVPAVILEMLAGGWKVVALGVGNAEPGREQGADGGLTGARYAHDHDDMGVCSRCIALSLSAVFVDT